MTSLKFILKVVIVLAAVGILITLNGCDQSNKRGGDEEGIIEFDSEAIDKKHPLYELAPGSATLKFKKEKFVIEMSAMGVFNTAIIANYDTKTLTQTVKFLNINQACVENENDLKLENADYRLKIEETDETKDIIGFKCYKAKVTKIDEPSVTFDVWYTKDLGMENSNALTPYAQIKGILLDYRIKRMGLELHLVAKSFSNVQVPDKDFELPVGVKMVSKEEMEKFFANL